MLIGTSSTKLDTIREAGRLHGSSRRALSIKDWQGYESYPVEADQCLPTGRARLQSVLKQRRFQDRQPRITEGSHHR